MMSLNFILLSLACLASAFAENGLRKELFFNATSLDGSRIVGGQPAARYEFPYQISYQLNGRHVCGGSIVTTTWVVTAGHCILGSPSNTRIVAGLLHQGESNSDVRVVGIYRQIVHPRYPGGVATNDIALLQLQQALSWSNAIQPIALPQSGQEFSGYGWVSGWGYLTSSNPVTPTSLQKVQLSIQSHQTCVSNLIRLIGSSYPLDTTMVCLVGAYTGRETVCQGDSGGPVMQNGVLVGVASWTIMPCGTQSAPSVYTKVSKHIDFIRQHVREIN